MAKTTTSLRAQIRAPGVLNAAAATCALFAWGAAHAQVPPTPGAVQDTVPQQRIPALSAPAEVVFPREVQTLRRDETRRFLVSGFSFTGNTVFSEAMLRRMTERYLDLQLTLAELDRVADMITAFYRNEGYTVARAYVPAQRVEDGLVTIQIIEGRIDSVAFKAQGRYSKEYLAPYLAPLTRTDPPPLVTDALLERSLLLMNDLPGLKARATLVPGTQFGTTSMEVDTQEKIIGASLGYSNSGRSDIGQNRIDAGVTLNNPLRLGDQFSLRAMRSTDSLFQYRRIGYSIPLNADGLRLSLSSTATDYDLGGAFAALQISGKVRSADATISYPFVRTRAKNVIGAIQWRDTTTDQTVLGLPFSSSKLQLLTTSIYANWVGADSSSTAVTGTVSTNAVSKGQSSTTGPYARFFKADTELTYLTGAAPNWDFFFRGRATISTTSLPDTEKYSIGGQDSVRGYPSASLRGDSGYQMAVELRRQWMVLGTPGYLSTFVDFGGVNNKGYLGYDRAASVGVGLTHYLGNYGQVKIEYAKPMLKLPGNVDPGSRVWVSLNLAF